MQKTSHIPTFVYMKITLLLVGKTAFPYINEGIALYEKRLAHYVNYNRVEIPELKGVQAMSKEQIKEKEVVLGHTEPLVVAVIPVVIILEALVPSTVCSHPVLTLTSKRYSVLSAPESPRPCLCSPTITITSYCSPIS